MKYVELAEAVGVKLGSIRKRVRRSGLDLSIEKEGRVHEEVMEMYRDKMEDSGSNGEPVSPVIVRPTPTPSYRTKKKKKKVDKVEDKSGRRWDILEVFFGSQIAVFWCSLVVVVLGSIAFAMAGRLIREDYGVEEWVFFLGAGGFIHYMSLVNIFRLNRKADKFNNPALPWITVFGIYEAMLHGANSGLYGEWADEVAALAMTVGIPLATAGISVVLEKVRG